MCVHTHECNTRRACRPRVNDPQRGIYRCIVSIIISYVPATQERATLLKVIKITTAVVNGSCFCQLRVVL
jgi:hypothetical protein